MFITSVAKAVIFIGIFGRLVSLQINESKKYRTLSDKNRFREWRLAPKRGTISDYFNTLGDKYKTYINIEKDK